MSGVAWGERFRQRLEGRSPADPMHVTSVVEAILASAREAGASDVHLVPQEAGLAMFFAVLGLAVQFPGIGGGYQVGIILALTQLFSIPAEPAAGAAILIWIMISVPCLVLGVIFSVYEGLTFKKLEAIAEEGRAAATEEL